MKVTKPVCCLNHSIFTIPYKQLVYLKSRQVLHTLIPIQCCQYLLQGWWCHKHHIGHQIRALEDLEALWVKVEHTDLLAVHHAANSPQTCA